MDTSSPNGGCLVGGVLDFPSFSFPGQPSSSSTNENIYLLGSVASVIPVLGNVTTQLNGVYVNGINANTPGVISSPPESQQKVPTGQPQTGFTGVIGAF